MNALTWKDIIDIEQILNQVRYEYNCGIDEESFGKEVLERFLEQRDELQEQPEDDIRNKDTQDKMEEKPRYCVPRYWDGQYDQSELFKKQPVMDCHDFEQRLEKEIDDYIEGCLGGLEGQEIASCARYFYKLGCRRTAEMYDDIEYNRQRAEEVEITNNLEEEVKRYFQGLWPGMETAEQCNTDMRFTPPAIMRLARHFTEWGAEHLKK